jgi:hypothetical protein
MTMLIKNISKNILLMALVFVLISSMAHAFNSGSTIFSWDRQTENEYTFIDKSMWTDQSLSKYGDTVLHSLWVPHTAGGTTYHNMDFTKDFWQPIESWEYQVCSQGLSTALAPKGNQVELGGSIYDTTITATASQAYVSQGNDSYLYELSWYVHPSGDGYHYSINLIGPGVDDVVKSKVDVGQLRGDQGYITFYSAKNYTKVKVIYNDTQYLFEIASAKDTNRILTS